VLQGRGPQFVFLPRSTLLIEVRVSEHSAMGREGGSQVAAGLIWGVEQASLRAAILLLCLSMVGIGGRHASHVKIVVGVDRKQLVIQRRTLFQKTDILSEVAKVGWKRSAP
jgi:hypothetical protein